MQLQIVALNRVEIDPKPQRSSSRQRKRSSSVHLFTAEVQNCPVCLDPMDVDLSYTESNTTTHNAIENSATFTTVCNHALLASMGRCTMLSRMSI
eukprot:scaffold798_cov268-Chaetoceros_neogracile.AAC.1